MYVRGVMLGDKIRIYRNWSGYKIETFAKMLGITRQTLVKWENGTTVPDVISMKKISDILGIPIEKFLAGNEEKELQRKMEGKKEIESARKAEKESEIESESGGEIAVKKSKEKQTFGPEERYFFGSVTIRKDGKIEIPQRAMKKLGIQPGEKMLLLGDHERGLELIYEDILWEGRRNKMLDELNFALFNEANRGEEFDGVDDE